ncbi:hypothetical protein VTH82DRAFT_5936 [Thermothelomyces myriococcoides]
MPALQHPYGDIAREIGIPDRYHPVSVSRQIYFAVAFLALLAIKRFLVRRSAVSPLSITGPHSLSKAKKWPNTTSTTPSVARKEQTTEPVPGHGCRSTRLRLDQLWGLLVRFKTVPRQLWPLRGSPRMDQGKSGLKEDHHPWSALAPSRGVSANSPQQAHDPSTTGPSPVPLTARTSPNRLRQTSSRESSSERFSDHSNGILGRESEGEAVAPMDGSGSPIFGDLEERGGSEGDKGTGLHFEDQHFRPASDSSRFAIPRRFSRPPPPLPLTPPTLHESHFPFEDREPSYASSVPPTPGRSFVRRPDPDPVAAPGSTNVFSSSPQSSTTLPQRRSYTKSVPIGMPASTATASASSSAKAATTSGESVPFSPSSYPPRSPILPPPPPSAPPEYVFVGGPGGPGVVLSQQEISLQGEILSVVDSAGHGWKRHTRVYGGGVCLACIAAAARDGGQGGFYGDKVPLEDRRY